jgi:hypothetical protein
MRNLILSALILASVFQTALGGITYRSGDYDLWIDNQGTPTAEVTITGYTGTETSVTFPSSIEGMPVKAIGSWQGVFRMAPQVTSVVIPYGVTTILANAFNSCHQLTSISIPPSVTTIETQAFIACSSLTSIVIPVSVMSMGLNVFNECDKLTSVAMPDRFLGQVAQIGLKGQVATDYLVNALANNDAFVTAVADKIKATSGNYGIATQSGVTSSISSVINEGRIAGVASVTASPNTWSLFTTSQIQNMAVGDLVLTRQVSGGFVLNYDIEQSTDLQTWTPYQALSLPLTGLPTDKAFVRIKAKQDSVINSASSQVTPTTEVGSTDLGSAPSGGGNGVSTGGLGPSSGALPPRLSR